MNKRRRIVPATELRIHLGEALKSLEEEDIVVEKGGVPIAMLIKYGREAKVMTETATSYEKALAQRAEAGGWERTLSAIERGWVGINEEELIENIYRWRQEGVTTRRYGLDDADDGEERDDDGSAISPGQRHLQQSPPPARLIADERAEYDATGGAGDQHDQLRRGD